MMDWTGWKGLEVHRDAPEMHRKPGRHSHGPPRKASGILSGNVFRGPEAAKAAERRLDDPAQVKAA